LRPLHYIFPSISKSVRKIGAKGLILALCSISAWTLLGQQLQHFLTSRSRLRVFNTSMAGLLLASLVPVFWHS
jgi:threonine/homoserine/homoserine lactone efflux protein